MHSLGSLLSIWTVNCPGFKFPLEQRFQHFGSACPSAQLSYIEYTTYSDRCKSDCEERERTYYHQHIMPRLRITKSLIRHTNGFYRSMKFIQRHFTVITQAEGPTIEKAIMLFNGRASMRYHTIIYGRRKERLSVIVVLGLP